MYNFEPKANIAFQIYYLSCGSKYISKLNGGNTFVKITVTPKIGNVDGTPLEWHLTNENDYLSDFYYDSNNFTLDVEIPTSVNTEGPYTEIGCVVSNEKGYGDLARGVKTLNQPK